MSAKKLRMAGFVLLGGSLSSALPGVANAQAQASQSEISAMKAQIQAMEQRLSQMQAAQDVKINEIKTKQQEAVEVKLSNGRPTLRTPDGMFEMALRGRAHFDTGAYFQDDDGLPAIAPGRDLGSGSNFRRARLGVEGKFMRDWGYQLEVNFGGSGGESSGTINYAWLSYSGFKPLTFFAGAMKPSMTMDDTTSSNEIPFIERPAAVNMAASFGAGDSRTAFGVRGNEGNFYASLYYTGGVIGEGGADEQSALVGRAAFHFQPSPDSTVHIGASGTNVFEFNQPSGGAGPVFTLQDRPELRIDGARLVSTGTLNVEDARVYGPEFGFNWKNLYGQAEYYRYDLDRRGVSEANFDGWYVQGAYILTGESRSYDAKTASFGGPRPSSPFSFGGSIGAVELAARYSTVNLDDNASNSTCLGTVSGGSATLNPAATSSCIRGGEQDIITLGVNWYPNRNVRFMLNYLIADVDRRAYSNNSVANGGPNAKIGQDYTALALRTQYNW
jgi:phosphate-selective porin OprO and OprP